MKALAAATAVMQGASAVQALANPSMGVSVDLGHSQSQSQSTQTSLLVKKSMSDCNWETIHGFESPEEYQRFCVLIESQVLSGLVEEVTVGQSKTMMPFGVEEKWFKCKASEGTWRRVAPEFPFRGLWDLVDDLASLIPLSARAKP